MSYDLEKQLSSKFVTAGWKKRIDYEVTCFVLHMVPEPHPFITHWYSHFFQSWREVHDCVHQQPESKKKQKAGCGWGLLVWLDQCDSLASTWIPLWQQLHNFPFFGNCIYLINQLWFKNICIIFFEHWLQGKRKTRYKHYSGGIQKEKERLSDLHYFHNKECGKILQTWAGIWIHWHSCLYQTLLVSFHCPGKTGYVSSGGL